MRILYYSPNPFLRLNDPAGYATHMREVIGGFRAIGNEVLPFIAGDSNTTVTANSDAQQNKLKDLAKAILPDYFKESIKDHRLLSHNKKQRELLQEKMRSFSPDLIYERGSVLQNSGISLARELKIPHILELNAPLLEEKIHFSGSSFYSGRADRMEKELCLSSAGIVVVSEVLKNYFQKKYDLPGSKFCVTPNGINPEKIKLSEQKIESIKKKYNLGSKLVIGFSGSIFPWHGVDLLIEAFNDLQKQNADVRLLIVGDGEILPDLKRKAESLGLSQQVHFTGNIPHDDIFNFISCMDICVMARSNWYGSPVKIFEYGFLGKAIVAPDTVPVMEVMRNGVDGFLVSPDKNEIAVALQRFIADQSLREKTGNAFREKVLKSHTWKMNSEKILNFYKVQNS